MAARRAGAHPGRVGQRRGREGGSVERWSPRIGEAPLTARTWNREQGWDRTFDINCKGTVRCCQAVIPGMQRRGRGRIVNIGSMAAHAQRRTSGAYTASKAAVLRYTKGLATALAGDGITVNAVCPGAVWTQFQRADMAAVVRDNPELADLPLEEVFERRYAEVIPLGRPQTGTDIANAATSPASACTSTGARYSATDHLRPRPRQGRDPMAGDDSTPQAGSPEQEEGSRRGDKIGGMTPEEMND